MAELNLSFVMVLFWEHYPIPLWFERWVYEVRSEAFRIISCRRLDSSYTASNKVDRVS
ncbi:hypothetical protein FOVG_09805 [Fusarium oxysporum f. sp. pisi HDV247]|uniref:Uncharacterized protein n=2 Tax=Fusarium oxysporum TaxID=5507 RepID=X0MLV1_FUSOX|nr:hypothetical protein FOVG_09805 [Fusarium oxysporum f. sp. pisi HDV247]EXM34381.1 hypothetical protein FOTG_01237 [Fusarium oxysporum f. sp. vasinfectum 25433]